MFERRHHIHQSVARFPPMGPFIPLHAQVDSMLPAGKGRLRLPLLSQRCACLFVVYVCLFMFVYVCLFVHLLVCLLFMFVCSFACLCLFACIYICLYICLLFFCLFVCLLVYVCFLCSLADLIVYGLSACLLVTKQVFIIMDSTVINESCWFVHC